MSYDIFDVYGSSWVVPAVVVDDAIPVSFDAYVDWPRVVVSPEEVLCLRSTVIVRY